jgi:hypothetical protein
MSETPPNLDHAMIVFLGVKARPARKARPQAKARPEATGTDLNRLRHADGTAVRYHGSIPDMHGIYKVRRCRCACCWGECAHPGCYRHYSGPRYELYDPTYPEDRAPLHVRHQSVTRLPHFEPRRWGPTSEWRSWA